MEADISSCTTLKHILANVLAIIRNHSWLLNSYVLDYYTEDHWHKLPDSWQQALHNVEPEELGQLLDHQKCKQYRRVWPLSLMALSAAASHFSLPRHYADVSENQEDGSCCDRCNKCSVTVCNCTAHSKQGEDNYKLWKDIVQYIDSESLGKMKLSPCISHPKLCHVFTKHVKPKKRHEIAKMAQTVATSARKQACRQIVDVGSGLGHLARMLAYAYGFQVCCLEAQDTLSHQAKKLDKELETTVSKYLSSAEMNELYRPVHINLTLASECDPSTFIKALKEAFGITGNEELRFGIVGLHPCGDLAPILMNLFLSCSEARFINIVGCCYMKLSTDSYSSFTGYPLSNFVSTQPHQLSYEAREIACHAMEAYCERLGSRQISDLRVHCYRATLERILVKHWPHLRHLGIRSVKHSNQMTFQEYCVRALSRLGVEVPTDDLNSPETASNLAQWGSVVTFYSLRLLLAPLVETVVLLDRLLWLRELGVDSILLPVFDPRLSPRNHVLIGTKRDTDR